MNTQKKAFSAALATLLLTSAGAVSANSVTNTMTNIVTLADACDVVAIGTDFGIHSAPIPEGGINGVVTANTELGNTITGNTAHPDAGADGGAANDDTLELTTPLSALNSAINAVLEEIDLSLPGVYVACTSTPSAIFLSGDRVVGGEFHFPTETGAMVADTLASVMEGVGGGADSSNLVDYELLYNGTVVSENLLDLINLFTGVFTSIGSIPSDQGGNVVVPGFYTDVLTATVEF